MKTTLQFDFLVDKEKNTITVKKEFAARRQLVWDCHTKSEHLDRWFAPKPYTLKTKHMDFKEGGYWLYAMVESDSKEYWGRMDYLKIKPIDNYSALDAFCDEQGKLNPELPRATWNVTFQDLAENCLVQTVVTYNSLKDVEAILEMGMKEGLTSSLENLDELLSELNK